MGSVNKLTTYSDCERRSAGEGEVMKQATILLSKLS